MTEDHGDYEHDHDEQCLSEKHATMEEAMMVELAMLIVEQHAFHLTTMQHSIEALILQSEIDDNDDGTILTVERGSPTTVEHSREALIRHAQNAHNAALVDFANSCRRFVECFEAAYGAIDTLLANRMALASGMPTVGQFTADIEDMLRQMGDDGGGK